MWRPIATAPRDGTEIIAACGMDGIQIVAFFDWADNEHHWRTPIDPAIWFEDPSHWMPIPECPRHEHVDIRLPPCPQCGMRTAVAFLGEPAGHRMWTCHRCGGPNFEHEGDDGSDPKNNFEEIQCR